MSECTHTRSLFYFTSRTRKARDCFFAERHNNKRRVNNKYSFAVILLLIAGVIAGVSMLAQGGAVGVLNPRGIIAFKERRLMLDAVLLMLLVVVPVFALTFSFAWRYRADNTRARYLPNWEHNRAEEFVWWGVPMIIIAVLAVITWSSAHALDPYRPLRSTTAPLTIQVVSLDWKWLFIYPTQGIATVNYLVIPEQTPIAFQLTSAAMMNALWIPQLGGQEMTMPGMVTKLHLMADGTGTYEGLSSNFSGKGFSGMQFRVQSVTRGDFDRWVAVAKQATSTLDLATYQALAAPSENNPPASYTLGDPGLYTAIVMRFLVPPAPSSTPERAGAGEARPPQMPMPGMAQ